MDGTERTEVLLVDDDALALEYLESMLDWAGEGFHIAGTALDGQQGYLAWKRLQPQLVIADVRMPALDGVAMAEKILAEDAGACVILVSNFDDFSYVRSALRAGIFDYILKNELTQDALREKLRAVQAELKHRRAQKSVAMFELVYAAFVEGNMGPHLPDERYQYLVVQLHLPFEAVCAAAGAVGFELPRAEMAALLQTGWEGAGAVLSAAHIGYGAWVLTLTAREDVSERGHRQRMLALASRLAAHLRRALGCEVSVFTIPLPLPLERAADIYRRGRGRLWAVRLAGRPAIAELSPYQPPGGGARPVETPREAAACENLPTFETLCAAVLRARVGAGSGAIGREVVLAHFCSAGALLAWLEHTPEPPAYSAPVRAALAAIEAGYARADFSVGDIAAAVSLSRSRISALFRDQTGKSINEALTETRLARAEQLLGEGRYRVYEVSEMVGYSSSQYFCKVFKKSRGITPFEIRKGG